MYNIFFITLLFIFIIQSGLFAQDVKKDTVPPTKAEKKQEKKLYSITQFFHETYLFVKQPVKWRGYDWLKVGLVTAATFSAMPLDKTGYRLTQGKQRYYNSFLVEAGRVYGEWYSIGGVAAAFGIYGLIAHNNSSKRISLELFQAGLYSELVTTALKIVIGRARPNSGEDAFTFHPFSVTNDFFHSMPSGHTTSAMALSTVMSRHAHSTGLKILAYVPAALTIFSRIYQNKHWFSDVVPAAAIGFFAGNWVVNLHEEKKHRINVVSIYPPSITISLDREFTSN